MDIVQPMYKENILIGSRALDKKPLLFLDPQTSQGDFGLSIKC